MRLLILLLPLLLFSRELKIATYNVDNLFDFVNNGTEYEEYIPNRHNWTKRIYQKKLSNIARVICDLDADVIGLQEVENSNALNELQKLLNRKGCRYRYSAITNKKSAINVALLSKVPIKRVNYIRVGNSNRDRDILEVKLKVDPPLTIFVNHWRSKAAPESQRVKYAKALINRIKKLPKGSEYIILGDFNSDYNECSVIDSYLNDTNTTCGIDDILHTFYKHHFLTLDDKNISLPLYHYNLWSELDPTKRWSHSFYGKKGSLDSIIIPPTLNDKKGWFYERGSFGVFKKGYLFKNHKIYRWQIKHKKHLGKGYSDHLPIYAIFSNSIYREPKYESIIDRVISFFTHKDREKIKFKEPIKYDFDKLKKYKINDFLKTKDIKFPVILKDVCVIYKRGDIGVIKDINNSKPITLYKSATELEEGRCYNLVVFNKRRYYKLNEITKLKIKDRLKTIDVNRYIQKFEPYLMDEKLDNIGEIVKDIKGRYKNRYLYIDGYRIKIYSKQKRKGIFRKNNKLFIKKAQIGYYKGEKELVIYSIDDVKRINDGVF